MFQRPPRRSLAGCLCLALVVLFTACASSSSGGRWIDEVRLSGASQIDADDVLAGLETRATPWYWWVPLLGERQWYDASAFHEDLRRIEHFYAARGFFAARIVDEQLTARRDGRALAIRVTVDEGRPTRTRALTIVGLDHLSPATRLAVTEELPLVVGARFDHGAYVRTKGLLCARLKALGYAYARCSGSVRVNRDRRTASVEQVVEAGPLVTMGPVRFSGAGPIPEGKLRSAVSWSAGDPYDPKEITRTRARLFRHQVFSSVRVVLPEEARSPAPVTIQLTPTKLREIRLGGGLGVEQRWQEVHLFGRWIWRNFLGGLRELELRMRPKLVAIPTAWAPKRDGFAGEGELQLTQPDTLGTRITTFGLLGYDLGLQDGYRFHGPHLRLGGDRTFARDLLRTGLSWNFRYLSFFDVVAFDRFDNPLGVTSDDAYRLAWLEPFVHFDWRDSIIDPRSGLFAELRLELGFPQIGGAFTYVKVTPDLRGYVPLWTKRLVLALRGVFSHLVPIEDQRDADGVLSPVTQRIWFGGPNSHRGFGYRRLAPQVYETSTQTDADGREQTVRTGRLVPVGGDSGVLLSADLRWRAFRLFSQWLHVIAFLDAGDVAVSFDELEFGHLHLATGGGLQIQTPIGSIGASVGFRLNRRRARSEAEQPVDPDPNDLFAVHLTIGGAF